MLQFGSMFADFAYISMLYWAVSSCSFGVLILCSMLQNPRGDTSSRLGGVPASMYSLFCTIFYMCSCYLSLAAKPYAGMLHISFKSFCHSTE